MSIQIESDLKEILGQINQNLEKLNTEVTGLNLRLTKVETKLDSELPAIKKSIDEIKGSQQAQIWTLIGSAICFLLNYIESYEM